MRESGAGHPLFAGGGEMGRAMAALDWASTPLGPPQRWPSALRSVVRILLTSRFPMWMGWGPELAFLYNDAYWRDTLRDKHPWALGRASHEVWAEIWDDIGPRVRSVLDSGTATWDEGLQLFLERSGYLEETYHTFSYSPLGDDADQVTGLLCVVSETTERVLSERRLQILSELGDISAVTAPTVEQACASAMAVLGRGRADIPFASIYLVDAAGARRAGHYGTVDDPRIVPAEFDRCADQPVWRVLADGSAQVLTGLATQFAGLFVAADEHRDGVRAGVDPDSAVAMPLAAGGGGAPVGVLIAGVSPFRALDAEYRRFLELVAGQVATAIADAAAYQAQLRRGDELAELDRAKTEFFTGVSHELRTPLTLIAGPAEDGLADREHPLPAVQRTRMELIARNSGRLRRLVDTLLDFARLEGGELTPDSVPVDLAALTRGIAESFEPAVARAGLELSLDCPALPSAVAVDPAMWEKIVLNLLSNAVKYTLHGGITLTLRADPGTGGLHLTVTDTGIGIPESDLPLLFRRFHRVRGATGRSSEGSGIGLALVAELVALLGGTVTVRSTLSRGSEFVVGLPAAALTGAAPTGTRATAAVALYRDEAMGWSGHDAEGPAVTPPDPGSADAATVLVAEDNTDLRLFVAGLLEHHYTVLLAEDGDTALRLARERSPDLVLTDVMMPGQDGFELLAALRGDPSTATIPVIMLSARAGEEATTEGLSAGADDYLTKPFSSHDLLARVRSNIALGRLRNHESAWRAALVNSLQDGLYIIDGAGDVVEVNDAFSTMLGYGTEGLPYSVPHPWWPDPDAEPAEFRQVADALVEVAATGRGRYLLPLRHRAGHRVWGDCAADSAPARDGSATMLVGTVRDVTAAHRLAVRDRVLAETGRLLGQRIGLTERLREFVALAGDALADLVVVSVVGPDGRLQPVAAAHRSHPERADAVLGLRAHRVPPQLVAAYEAGHAFVIDPVGDDLLGAMSVDEADLAARRALRARTSLVAPLVVAGRLLGSLTFTSTDQALSHDASDLALAEELARRLAGMVDADRVIRRERQLHAATTALAAAATVAEAATALAQAVVAAMGATGIAVYRSRAEEQRFEMVHLWGTPPESGQVFGTIRADDPLPVADAARTGEAVWLGDRPAWQDRYPYLAVPPSGTTAEGVAALPLRVGGRVVGVLAAGFSTERAFPADERSFALTLVGQAAQAFDRAAVADTRWQIAQTLQQSLLPAALPDVERLGLAVRYLAAIEGTHAGGDWYDVLELDERRTAIVVGDVVGHGPGAASVMGQLRSALAAYLLQGLAPADALRWLTRFARRVPGAPASTVVCVVVDTHTGDLRWARAGHPPPLVVDGTGARFLADAQGAVLGISDAPPFVEGRTTLAPGASVLLYTDGLVERRDEDLDEGLDRLARAAAQPHLDPAALIETVLAHALGETGPADDVALIAARLRPAPLHGQRPATADQLAPVRREVEAWAAAGALTDELLGDLQLVLGEALANAVEHAYPPGSSGSVGYRLSDSANGVCVEVRDQGTWRPPSADPGFRGRGLSMIHSLGRDVTIESSGPGTGTLVRFTVARPAPAPAAAPNASGPNASGPNASGPSASGPNAAPPPATAEPPRMTVHTGAGAVRIELSGELDLITLPDIRAAVLEQVRTRPDRIVLDLRAVTYLPSVGVGLLSEIADTVPGRLELAVRAGGSVARILALTGLDERLVVSTSDAAEPEPVPDAARDGVDPVRAAPGPNAIRITVHRPAPAAVQVQVSGDVDAHNVAELADRAESVVDGRSDLVLDLTGVRFLGSSGLRVVMQIQRLVEGTGRRLLVVTGPHRAVRRAMTVTGLDEVLQLHTTVAEAMAARAG